MSSTVGFVRVLPVLAFAASAGLSLSAKTCDWNNSGTMTPITQSADFYALANWLDEAPPESQDSAFFYKCPSGVWSYITSAKTIDARGILTCNHDYAGSRDVAIVSDAGFSITGSGTASGLWIGPTIYGDVVSNLRLVTWSVNLCGDFVTTADANNAQGQITLSAGVFRNRLDRYANSPDPVRVNPMRIQHFYIGAGDWAIHSPRSLAEDVKGKWNQTENSPYLFPAAGTSHVLPVGTIVTGEGVPNETFLRRVFPDGSIELSKSIEAGKSLAANELTFSAFSPKVSISCQKLSISASDRRSGWIAEVNAPDLV